MTGSRGRLRQLARHSFVYGVGGLVSKLVGIFLLPIYTHRVNKAQFGEVEQVMAFYESKLKDAGFKVQKMTMSGDNGTGGTVSGESDKRTVGVALSTADGKTQALVTFNEKN